VIVGGLVTSTLLSLFVVPVLYLGVGGGPRPAMTPEEELIHRWAGQEPVAAGGRREGVQTEAPAVLTQEEAELQTIEGEE
jgi:hypothetical protein